MPEEQKKDKKEKKKEKKEKKEKAEKDQAALEEERFKPVANPAYNPLPASEEEGWTVSSSRSSLPLSVSSQNLTPAELQGFAAEKFVPSSGYAHLDPSQHKNAHSAFERLQQVVRETQQQNPSKPPSIQPLPKLTPPNKQPVPTPSPARPTMPVSSFGTPPIRANPSATGPHERPPHTLPPESPKQQVSGEHYRVSPSRPPQPQLPPHHIRPQPSSYRPQQRPIHSQPLPRHPTPQQPRPPPFVQRLEDGMRVMHHARAIWSYNAKIASELTFAANEYFGVINKQPDGWWYVELLNPQRRRRGLVPGNYMAPL
ncbi:hypothetical protein BY458DRAFT_526277 [Sporodiniella umbellata]|nr:hypothetical protein BY458DRAFT_526277 [Sporodiniella umbellata]